MAGNGCVVVGVDFSPASRRALELATLVSDRAGFSLELVHAWNAAGAFEPPTDTATRRQRMGEKLDEWAAPARALGVSVETRVVGGFASRELPDRARVSGAGLVVVGRRGASGLPHVRLGSVSERVVHQAMCPVLVVPDQPVALPERMLVGVDFSDSSRHAFQAALRLARRLGSAGGLLLVHARPSEQDLYLENWSELVYRGRYAFETEDLVRWARKARAEDPPGEGREPPLESVVLEGRVEPMLDRVAGELDCAWLVLGLQGRTALASFLMGSTTDRVLKLATRPVLVVPAREAPAGPDGG